jgi:hypothetical protein
VTGSNTELVRDVEGETTAEVGGLGWSQTNERCVCVRAQRERERERERKREERDRDRDRDRDRERWTRTRLGVADVTNLKRPVAEAEAVSELAKDGETERESEGERER